MIKKSLLVIVFISYLLTGCDPYADMAMLDKAIPLVETPNGQIATICTKRYNGRLIQTRLLDRSGRILEEYNFGRSNSRVRNEYEGPLKVRSVTHYHSDSSVPGYTDIIKRTFSYDRLGRLQTEKIDGAVKPREVSYAYTATGDTIRTEKPAGQKNKSILADADQWTRNNSGQLTRHYALYVLQMGSGKVPDTVWHSSQRYAYAADGKRVLAWYDYMYLGRFYIPEGPDTIRYQYDQQGRLVAEQHRYTVSMKNKQEIDSTKLDSNDRRTVRTYRNLFFNGATRQSKSDKTNSVRYQYDVLDPKQHLPLYVPPLD